MLFFYLITAKLYLWGVKFRYVLLLVFFGVQALAQQAIDSLAYREDQFYLDVNLLLQANDIDNFRQNGFSRSIHFGFLRDISLNKNGNRALALGIGYGYQRWVNTLNIDKEDGLYVYNIPSHSRSLSNVFSYHKLQFPIELRWRTSTATDFDFWRVYLGYRLSYQFAARYHPFFGPDFRLVDQLTPWQHSFGVSTGYGSWNLRLAYEIHPLLNQEIQLETGARPRIYPIHLGLIFYFL